jgi:CheY-like chemotaxis protein/HPt (histidine-containing phosphotransfer) domain-containing protein
MVVMNTESFRGRAPTAMDEDSMLAELKREFLDDVRHRLEAIQKSVDQIAAQQDDLSMLPAIWRDVHNIKGLAGGYALPTLSMVAHRCEDYLRGSSAATPQFVRDLQIFIDEIARLVARGDEPPESENAAIFRRLPVRVADFDPSDVAAARGEAVIVAAAPMVSRILSRELAACGFRSVTVADPFEALAMVARARPDCVLTSAVLHGASGADLARALSVMGPTRDMRVAVVTSLSGDKAEIKDLPSSTSLVRFGRDLADDLGAFLATLSLARASGEAA